MSSSRRKVLRASQIETWNRYFNTKCGTWWRASCEHAATSRSLSFPICLLFASNRSYVFVETSVRDAPTHAFTHAYMYRHRSVVARFPSRQFVSNFRFAFSFTVPRSFPFLFRLVPFSRFVFFLISNSRSWDDDEIAKVYLRDFIWTRLDN